MAERLEVEQDSIRGSLAEAVAAAETPVPEPVEVKTEAEPVAVETEGTTKPETVKPDKPTGKETTAPKEAAKPVKADDKNAAKPDAAPKEAAKPETPKAPDNWSAEHKKAFEKLDADGKKFLLDRHSAMEADYTKKTTELANQRKDYETIDKIFAPHETAMKAQGFTKASMVQAWANVELELMDPSKRANTISRIIGAYKIPADDIARLLGVTRPAPAPANGAQPQAQPQPEAEQPWQRELGAIKQRLDMEDRQRYEARASELNTQITSFRTEADKDGNPLHPYFDDVEQDMVRLVAGAQARGEPVPPVSKLYEDAVWANPTTRSKMLEAQTAATEASTLAAQQEAQKEEREAARAKAEKAKRAAKSVTGAPGSGNAPTRQQPARSLRDTIAAHVEEAENSAAA